MRDQALHLPLSSEERERFERVAQHHDLPVEAMIRFLVRREEHWLAPPESLAHSIQQQERRGLVESARKRLGTDADL
jgi:hypothetical protein